MAERALSLCYGHLPPGFPGGLYVRNGPDLSRELLAHPLDGPGRVDRVRFRGSRAYLTSRALDLPRGGRRRAFGGGSMCDLRVHNAANTSVMRHAGRLFALWEAGLPTELDAESLAVRGQLTFAGIPMGSPASTGHAWVDAALGLDSEAVCAHPVRDAGGRLSMLTSKFLLGETQLRVLELAERSFDVAREHRLTAPGFTHVHGGFAATPSHFALFLPALAFDARLWLRGCGVQACVSQLQTGNALALIPRAGGAPRVLPLRRGFVTHVVNAFDEPGGGLVVDAVAANSLASVGVAVLRRLRVGAGAAVAEEVLHARRVEFPCINPAFTGRPHRFIYSAAEPWDGWLKLDLRNGRVATARCAAGPHLEPVFVARRGAAPEDEDDGFLVGFALVRGRSVLCVADARTMRPLCAFDAPDANACGLHGVWLPDKG